MIFSVDRHRDHVSVPLLEQLKLHKTRPLRITNDNLSGYRWAPSVPGAINSLVTRMEATFRMSPSVHHTPRFAVTNS